MRARHPLLILLLALGAGCVPRARLVEARAALDAETSGRKLAEATVAELRRERSGLTAKVAELRSLADRRDGTAAALERDLAQSRLELTNLSQERAEALLLVDQLREELARVGEHLREFSEEKKALGVALSAAERKAEELMALERASKERALLVRDLALALHEPVATGEVELSLEAGTAVLRVPAARLFQGDRLGPRAAALLAAVAGVVRIHQGHRIELEERGLAAAAPTRDAQLERIAAKLVSQGVARGNILMPGAPADGAGTSGEPTVELRLAPRS